VRMVPVLAGLLRRVPVLRAPVLRAPIPIDLRRAGDLSGPARGPAQASMGRRAAPRLSIAPATARASSGLATPVRAILVHAGRSRLALPRSLPGRALARRSSMLPGRLRAAATAFPSLALAPMASRASRSGIATRLQARTRAVRSQRPNPSATRPSGERKSTTSATWKSAGWRAATFKLRSGSNRPLHCAAQR
jgi:hypothetical protein